MDGKSIRNKLIGDEQERAVSPVIGVILMVAITVILAAVIAAFVLDLGQGQQANPQAGIQFDHDSANTNIEITVNSVERADGLSIQCDGTDAPSGEVTGSLSPSAGSSVTLDYSSGTCDDTTTVQIIGTLEGNSAVITTFDDHTN